jgi:BTB/POZ domain-containing protein 17
MQQTIENERESSSPPDSAYDEIGDQQSVLLKVAALYATHLMSDITLNVGENIYPAHRVILSASSDVFAVMLMNPQWSESKESVITLKEDPQCCRVFPKFLKYLYTGQVRVSIDSAMPLLSLADKYNIKDLIVLCRDYMLRNIAIAGRQGFLVSWLQYTLAFNYHQHLSNELKNFLRLNVDIVGYSRDFADLDPNNLVILVSGRVEFASQEHLISSFCLFLAPAK